MSWVAVAGGVLLGPTVGYLASRIIQDNVKPKELSHKLFIDAGAHAAAAVGAYALIGATDEVNVQGFAYGATWGSGILAGLLGSSGLYATTEAGKQALSKYGYEPRGQIAAGADHGRSPVPGGLLGLLSAARDQGY
jgi:hypothetical protein